MRLHHPGAAVGEARGMHQAHPESKSRPVDRFDLGGGSRA